MTVSPSSVTDNGLGTSMQHPPVSNTWASSPSENRDESVPVPAIETSGSVDPTSAHPRNNTDYRNTLEEVAITLAREAIGHTPNFSEMQTYANEMRTLGLHSVSMIIQFCGVDDVDEWQWMKPFHKKALKAWLREERSSLLDNQA